MIFDLDHPQHSLIKALDDSSTSTRLPKIRLFENYALGTIISLRHVADFFRTVEDSFWKDISHFLVVASLGIQNLGKSFLLNVLFHVQLPVFDGVATTFVDLVLVRYGDTLIVVLDTEGTNSAIEQRRDAAEIDDVPTGESVRANFAVAAAHIILLSVSYSCRNHYEGFVSELDALFAGAKRNGAPTNVCIVVLVVRDIDVDFRDSRVASSAASEILGAAEQRRQFHLEHYPESVAQLSRFQFRISLLPNPRDHHDPATPAPLANQQLDARRRFTHRARSDFKSILEGLDMAKNGSPWRGFSWYVDVLEGTINDAFNPPYGMHVAARYARRAEIDDIVASVRALVKPRLQEEKEKLVKAADAVVACLAPEIVHDCRVTTHDWSNSLTLQAKCNRVVCRDLYEAIVLKTHLSDTEQASAYMRRYAELLRDNVAAAAADLWSSGRTAAHAALGEHIARSEQKVTSLIAGIDAQQPDPLLQGILDGHPELRSAEDNTYVSIWRACFVAREIACSMRGFTCSPGAEWFNEAQTAHQRLLHELKVGFDRHNTAYRRVLIRLPGFLAAASRFTGQVAGSVACGFLGGVIGLFLGPPGVILGALSSTMASQFLVMDPLGRVCEALGRMSGRMWQRALQGVVRQRRVRAIENTKQ